MSFFKGRCTWVNVAVKQSESWNEDENEELEEEREEPEPEPEVGPPLLTPLSQDAGSPPRLVNSTDFRLQLPTPPAFTAHDPLLEIFNTPPWTLKLSSSLTPDHAVAVIRSNIWPGAHAYACGK